MPTPRGELAHSTTHYDILGLPQTARLQQPNVKAAYHRALLKHHPDKSRSSTPSFHITASAQSFSSTTHTASLRTSLVFTVDQITLAYKVLSDPRARAEYDRSLRLAAVNNAVGTNSSINSNDQVFRTGLEVFDLDDMDIEIGSEGSEIWFRGCRCGDTKGFFVSENDLEEEMERGEIFVGCRGCSLWAKILFAVDEGGQDSSGEKDVVTGLDCESNG